MHPSLKITTTAPTRKADDTLVLAADVSKRTLNLYARFERRGRSVSVEDVVANGTRAVEHALAQVQALASEHGFSTVRVVCEASGGYERLLLATARRLGLGTALVSAEQSRALSKLVSLDTGKTDRKDARAIHLAAAQGKTQTHRRLSERYVLLRRLTAFHDDEAKAVSTLRQQILQLITELFPDYPFSAPFTFSKTGRVLLGEGLLDPARLVRLGHAHVLAMLRRRVSGVKAATAERLVTAAEASARGVAPAELSALLGRRLAQQLHELETHERHAGELRAQIEQLGEDLKRRGALPALDEHVRGLSLFNLARLVGETGPLQDFASKRHLLRYAGMNLRERESGTYKGQTRLSKKGRPMLRKVLGQAAFPLLRRDRLLGERYAERCGRMPSQKAKVAAMRKLLVLVYGVHRATRRGERFEAGRVHVCQSQYAAA